ncbi:MAG: YbjN domain-containing protein [Erythrobacter sp.]
MSDARAGERHNQGSPTPARHARKHRAFAALWSALGILGLIAGAPLVAQDSTEMLIASKPAGIVIAMLNAGYNPELTTDRMGDPMIVSRGPNASLFVFFFGCHAETHDNCHSIRFQVGFDRSKPWNAQDALNLANELPFLSVRLDKEGDPFLHWDLVMGDGILRTTFVKNLRAFDESVTTAAETIYAEEKAELLQQQ